VIEPGQETYLGDGLYASHDGYQVKLRAGTGDLSGDMVVYLEPGVIKAFERWLARLRT
jgi:hypothetical protein